MNTVKKNTEYDKAKLLSVSFPDNMILLLRKPECKVCLHGHLHSVGYKRLFKNEFFLDIRMSIPMVLWEEKTVRAFDSFQFELLIPQIPPTFMLPNIPAALVQSLLSFPGNTPTRLLKYCSLNSSNAICFYNILQ